MNYVALYQSSRRVSTVLYVMIAVPLLYSHFIDFFFIFSKSLKVYYNLLSIKYETNKKKNKIKMVLILISKAAVHMGQYSERLVLIKDYIRGAIVQKNVTPCFGSLFSFYLSGLEYNQPWQNIFQLIHTYTHIYKDSIYLL